MTVNVSAFAKVVLTVFEVAVSKLNPCEITAVAKHVPLDLIARRLGAEMVQLSELGVEYVIVASPDPAEGVAIKVVNDPNFRGETILLKVRFRVALLTVSVAGTIVTAVYESVSDDGANGVMLYVPALVGRVDWIA